MARERRRVLYSGRVQGVGFRITAQDMARRFEVAGYVRNLPDGRVELVAEGEPDELDAFLKVVRSQMVRKIESACTERHDAEAPLFEDFSIRY